MYLYNFHKYGKARVTIFFSDHGFEKMGVLVKVKIKMVNVKGGAVIHARLYHLVFARKLQITHKLLSKLKGTKNGREMFNPIHVAQQIHRFDVYYYCHIKVE